MSTGDNQRHNALPSPNAVPAFAPIKPRGDPDEHRQAMTEEIAIQQNELISQRRKRNTQAAARMRERQKQREQNLIEHHNKLISEMKRLETELSSIKAQRQQPEVDEDHDSMLQRLSDELEIANSAMVQIKDEVEKLVDIAKSIDI
ncbi:hypothetical protein BX661DRAFT_185046 [Kickxella alabastrina]|uniref:uncharacterized protein n=1 Tax=Kickxella alabastrina TaxID=61397 RepID=UPI00221F816E|nr:uncharacterized protein BX661DRAFT_185046 [Kickxella alabastrina]KAI7824977.1 hypothetical protein BX661DRAFT_185046 [Kickxella alabastrina]KAJ1937597.1 hypothetical protein GGF37_005142 [Kickxella alabastrina]